MSAGGGASPVSMIVDAQLALILAGVAVCGDARPHLRHRQVGEAYGDAASCVGDVLAIDDGAVVQFELPADVAVDFIMLRLSALPGTYRIDAAAIAGRDVAALQRRVMHAVQSVLDTIDESAVRIAADGAPPLLELDVRGLFDPDTGPHHLRFRVRREDALAGHLASLSASCQAQHDALSALLRTQVQQGVSAVLDAQSRAISDATDWWEERASLTAASVEALASQLSVATAALDAAAQHRAEQARAIEDLQASQLTVLAALEQLTGATRAAAETGDAHSQQLERLHTQVAAARRSIDGTLWRRLVRRLSGDAR